jgi:hypothetical protein
MEDDLGVRHGIAMDSLKFHPGPPCPTFGRPAGEPPLKRPYIRFRGGLLAGRAACGHLLPLWTPHAVRVRMEDDKREGKTRVTQTKDWE